MGEGDEVALQDHQALPQTLGRQGTFGQKTGELLLVVNQNRQTLLQLRLVYAKTSGRSFIIYRLQLPLTQKKCISCRKRGKSNTSYFRSSFHLFFSNLFSLYFTYHLWRLTFKESALQPLNTMISWKIITMYNDFRIVCTFLFATICNLIRNILYYWEEKMLYYTFTQCCCRVDVMSQNSRSEIHWSFM